MDGEFLGYIATLDGKLVMTIQNQILLFPSAAAALQVGNVTLQPVIRASIEYAMAADREALRAADLKYGKVKKG